MKGKKALVMLLFVLMQSSAFSQQTYHLDTKKSKLLWNMGKIMGGHYGYMLFNSGLLFYSASGEPLNGSFNIDLTSAKSTDHAKESENYRVDTSLPRASYLNTAQFPAAVMNVKRIVRNAKKNSYKGAGELSFRGITNTIVFDAMIVTANNTAHITADIVLRFDMWWPKAKPKTLSLDFVSGVPEKSEADFFITLDLTMTK